MTICLSRPAFGQDSPPPAPAASAPIDVDPERAARSMTQHLTATLRDLASTKPQRDEAARRLLEQNRDEAKAALRATLTDPSMVDSQIAVARALADNLPADPLFIDPLFNAFGANKALNE